MFVPGGRSQEKSAFAFDRAPRNQASTLKIRHSAERRTRSIPDQRLGRHWRVSSTARPWAIARFWRCAYPDHLDIRAGSTKNSSHPALVTCAAHGLHYDPAKSSGCVLCRKSQRPAAPARTGKWLLVGGALASLACAAAAWVVRGPRALSELPAAELPIRGASSALAALPASSGSHTSPGPDPGPATNRSDSSLPSSAPASSGGLTTRGTLSAQTFGVSPELIPRFFEAVLMPTLSLPARDHGEAIETLTARVAAERASCEQGSIDACLNQLNECEKVGSLNRGQAPGLMIGAPMTAPPSGQLGRSPRALLARECQAEHAWATLPAACEGGSVAACNRLLGTPNHEALLPRACDVGSRNACIELSRSLGFSTLAGEAARLRALELGKCSPPGSTCPAHSRAELTETARNTLRAGMNQVCVQRGPSACRELMREFDQEHSDAALRAELRGYNCELGHAESCTVLATMYADGLGVPRDEQKALALNERVRAERNQALKEIDACDAGDCALLKVWTQAHAPSLAVRDAMEDAQLAPDQETRKCDGGELKACLALINVFNVGRHPDQLRAAEFRRKAAALLASQCNLGKADACDAMADILIALGGNDRARGLGLLDRSCNDGRLGACLELATKLEDREQKASALRRALPLQEAQCTAGNALACLWAADEYRTRDPQKSAALKARGEKLVLDRSP